MNSFYSEEELKDLNLKSYGKNVKISRKCSIYGAENIEVGNNVRIDDFTILSGNIKIGNNVHISAYCALYGKNEIELQDYSGCSARCTIYSETDDFSGEYMVGAVIPEKYTNVNSGKVLLGKYSQLGANTIVMPNIKIGEGAVTGSLTFVNRSLEDWTINIGIPVKKMKNRKKDLLKYVSSFENECKVLLNGKKERI